MRRTFRQIEWSGRRHPTLTGWIVEASFRIGDGERGYDNRVQSIVEDREIEFFGPRVLERHLHDMIATLKQAAYEAICDDRLLLALSCSEERARHAADRAWAAERKSEEVQAKLDTIKELLGIVEREHDK